MKYLTLVLGTLLFLGTLSAYAGPNTDKKIIIGGSATGVFFMIDGQETPWLCRPEGDDIVSCDSQGIRYLCTYEDAPVFFKECDEGTDEVLRGLSTISV